MVQEVKAQGKRVLCRTENYADCHSGFSSLLRSKKLLHVLGQLAGEEMILFKEKINYKLAGSGGFSQHIDAVAYTHVKDIKHLTILVAVDSTDMSNGGLEVVDGSHEMDIPINEVDHYIQESWVKHQKWTPAELESGECAVHDVAASCVLLP
jgi:ectoine hydroxylase-related dioxygenase (phytanoyl-CoA dioxygenase family)